MMTLPQIGHAVKTRRLQLGLSQARLARLSGLSRQTLIGLENGTLSDLGVNRTSQVLSVLGLDLPIPVSRTRPKKRALWMAAKNAGVSYSRELSPETLGSILASGKVPSAFVPHMAHILDETPVPVVVMAVEEAAHAAHVPSRRVWRNVGKLASTLSMHRKDLWR
ncbi:MAG TPA: helix-turn-helix domain-containing protein [Oleiagrimonas sp.]|nr:helix-turn-helix domain-containing protein [Oleiagrimonas sp.]